MPATKSYSKRPRKTGRAKSSSSSTIAHFEVQVGLRRGRPAAQYRAIGTNGHVGNWHHMTVGEAAKVRRTRRWLDHPATVRDLTGGAPR